MKKLAFFKNTNPRFMAEKPESQIGLLLGATKPKKAPEPTPSEINNFYKP